MTQQQVIPIKEIKSGMRGVSIANAVVLKVEEKRQVNLKSGGFNFVQDILLGDETGEIAFSAWGGDVGKFSVGDRLNISNGYVNTYKGKNSLSTGKFGKIEKAQ